MKNYRKTKLACYLSFVTQAIASNFPPLLYMTFYNDYNIPLGKIALISSLYFIPQLIVDLACVGIIERIGQRKSIIIAEALSSIGVGSLAVLPELFNDPFTGIAISVILYATGSGMIEIIANPIIEACPFDNKEAEMSLLHSFYCWGVVGTILFSTLFFNIFGIENWKWLSVVFAIEPAVNIINFVSCPIDSIVEISTESMSFRSLLAEKNIWIGCVMMICAACCEFSLAQWASAYAESALGLTKTVGDLAGPCLFAAATAICRLIFGKIGDEKRLHGFMLFSSVLCFICYLMVSFSSNSAIGLTGCMMCGFSIGTLWPGTITAISRLFPNGGTELFAILAVAGAVGGSIGPAIVGKITEMANNNLRAGLAFSLLFPVIMIVMLLILKKEKEKKTIKYDSAKN